MLSLLKKIKRIIVNIIFYYIAQQSLDRSKIIRKYNKYLIFYFKSEKIKNESKHYKVYENNIFKFLKFYKKTINLPQPFILKLNKGWILGKCDTPVFLDDSLNVILESVNFESFSIIISPLLELTISEIVFLPIIFFLSVLKTIYPSFVRTLFLIN